MKIEKISNNKIKIELEEKEITRWSRIADNRVPDYNAMMMDLISAAEKETGLSFQDCQVVVEASRSNNNTYIIYVTRNSRTKASVRRTKVKSPTPHKKTNRIVAEFTDIESICQFDRHYPLYANLLAGANTLYSYNNMYYLDITVPANFEKYADSLSGNLSEFSANTLGTIIPYQLSEYGKCLIKTNALFELRKIK
ncbi:MAG: adaptor protein MecA [Bacillota bacterium]|nr:adaptor protein MecA [Bacillota bacterium]